MQYSRSFLFSCLSIKVECLSEFFKWEMIFFQILFKDSKFNFKFYFILTTQEFERLLQQSRDCFAMLAKTQFRLNRLAVQAGDKGVQTRSPHKLMLAKKSIKLRLNLRKRHYQLTFIFYQMIRIMFNSPYNNDVVFDSALQLCSLYNDAVSCAMQFHASSGAQVCSRFFPPLLITPKKLDISQILQV